MQRDEVVALLRRAATSGDDWYQLNESEDGLFQAGDGSGAAAVIAVEEHWAEVRAGRSLGPGSHALPALAPGSLLRAVVQPGDPPALLLRGRVYLDGFSLHALYCTVRDVFQLAGPLPIAEAEIADAVEAPAVVPVVELEDETPTEVSRQMDEPPESGVSQAVDEAYVAVSSEPDLSAGPDAETSAPEPSYTPLAEEMAVPDALHAVAGAEVAEYAPAVEEATPLPEAWETPEPEPVAEPEARPPRMDTPFAGTPIAAVAASAAPTPVAPPAPPAPPMTSMVGSTVQMSRAEMRAALDAEEVAAPPVASPQICRRCGSQVESGERFCINCGAPQPSVDPPPPPAAGVPPLRRSAEPETVAWRRPGSPDAPDLAATVSAAAPARCGRCGYDNPPGNRFCQGCGSALAAG